MARHVPKNIKASDEQIIEAMVNYHLASPLVAHQCGEWKSQDRCWLLTKWSMLSQTWKNDVMEFWLRCSLVGGKHRLPAWSEMETYIPNPKLPRNDGPGRR